VISRDEEDGGPHSKGNKTEDYEKVHHWSDVDIGALKGMVASELRQAAPEIFGLEGKC